VIKVGTDITYISLYACLRVKIHKVSSQHNLLIFIIQLHLHGPKKCCVHVKEDYYYSLSGLSQKATQALRKESQNGLGWKGP